MLATGCFSPTDPVAALDDALEEGDTEGAPEEPSRPDPADGEPEESDDASTTGGVDEGADTDGLDTDGLDTDGLDTDGLDTDGLDTDGLDTETDGDELECTQLGTIADCLACGDSCDPEGACMAQGCVAPALLGHATAFGNNLGGPVDQFLWGFPIQVTTLAHLTGLGFYANPPAHASDPAAQVALYSDVAGQPSALLAAMSPVYGLGTGHQEQAVGNLVLQPGTYWLMGTSTGPVPFAVQIAVNNQGLPTFPVAMVPHTFGSPLPAVLQNVSTTNSHAPNFYARVLQ